MSILFTGELQNKQMKRSIPGNVKIMRKDLRPWICAMITPMSCDKLTLTFHHLTAESRYYVVCEGVMLHGFVPERDCVTFGLCYRKSVCRLSVCL